MKARKLILLTCSLILISASVKTAVAQDSGEVGFENGVFSLKSSDENFEMKIGGRFQFRYWYAYPDDDDPYVVDEETSTFEVYQARFFIWGNAFGPKWTYKLQLDFAASDALKDAMLDYAYADYLALTMGRFKVPFTRQKLTSGTVLLFPRRSISNDFFTLGRDVGLMLHGRILGERFTYDLGIFNGDGEKAKTNSGKLKMYTGRLVIQPLGPVSLDEARLKSTPGFKFAVGGSYSYNEAPAGDLDHNGIEDDAIDTRWGAETALTWGRLYMAGEVNGRFYDPDVPGYSYVNSLGWYAQTGLLIVPEKLQLGARYSWLDPDTDNDNRKNKTDITQEATVGLNYFIHGVRLLMQGSYSVMFHDYAEYPDPADTGVYNVETGIEHRFVLQLQAIL